MSRIAVLAACGLLLAACDPMEPGPQISPTVPLSAAPGDPGPFAPEPPASVAEIRANPTLRQAWRFYCDDIRDMAFIMIYPPPPGAERIAADQTKCREIFGA